MAGKISDFIRKSPIGKNIDKKTLSAIDMVFEKSVKKAIEQNLTEKVAVENQKFKVGLMETLDLYIEQVVNEEFKKVAIDKSKLQLADKIVESFKSSFGEIFVTEGTNKLAGYLKNKISEIKQMEENHQTNIQAVKALYEKKLKDAQSQSAVKDKKYRIAVKEMAMNDAKATIESDVRLSKFGKAKLVESIQTRFKDSVPSQNMVKNMIESYVVRENRIVEKPRPKPVISEKMKGEGMKGKKDDGNFDNNDKTDLYVEQLDRM